MSSRASETSASGLNVTGSTIMPASERFTLSTSATCSATGRFLCTTPMPPSRASAIAIPASVTVSIAAETIGISISIPRAKRVCVEASPGRTSDSAGTSRTSPKVSPSFANFRSSVRSRSISARPSSSSTAIELPPRHKTQALLARLGSGNRWFYRLSSTTIVPARPDGPKRFLGVLADRVELVDLGEAREATRLPHVEPPCSRFEDRGRAGSDSAPYGVLEWAPRRARRDERCKQDVPRTHGGDSFQDRRAAAKPVFAAVLTQERITAARHRQEDVSRTELRDLVESGHDVLCIRELVADERLCLGQVG